MKRLLIFILLAAVAWFSLWGFGHFNTNAAYEKWFKDRRNAGWLAEFDAMKTRGFPNRLDTTFENITLADQNFGYQWNAEKFKLFKLVYKPNHIIALWPDQQVLKTPNQTNQIYSNDMRASIVVDDTPHQALKRANLVVEKLRATRDRASEISIDSWRLAIRSLEEMPTTIQLALQAEGVSWRPLAEAETPSLATGNIRINLSANFDSPWGFQSFEHDIPAPTEVTIQNAQATWNNFEVALTGSFTIDAQGYPTGNLKISAENWNEVREFARKAHPRATPIINALEKEFRLVPGQPNWEQPVDFPITVANQQIYLGSIPIGTAPIFWSR
ncbi:MAG: DUF2125 domain-containing protein [Cognatishimia sp.]